MSDPLQPHGLYHNRLPCPSLSPGVCSNSCPLNRWCHPTISSSVIPFSSCLQSFPASGSFPVSWLFVLGGQSIGAPTSAAVLPLNIQGWFPLGLTCLIKRQYSARAKCQGWLWPWTKILDYLSFSFQKSRPGAEGPWERCCSTGPSLDAGMKTGAMRQRRRANRFLPLRNKWPQI